MTETADRFVVALQKHAPHFDLELSEIVIADLRRYYDILQPWNPRLHLVAPCSPEVFAVRHVLESLLAIKYIPDNAHVVDIGSGGGLPIIPCLIARPDINATLFESSAKKAVFLGEALRVTNASERAVVITRRFEDAPAPKANVVTCRAIERFTDLLKTIIEWSPTNSTMVFFGGPSLQVEIEKTGVRFIAVRIPQTEQRFVFVIKSVNTKS